MASYFTDIYSNEELGVYLTHRPFRRMSRSYEKKKKKKKKRGGDVVDTVTAKKMLSETLDGLSSEALEEFKTLVELETGFPLFSRSQLKVANTQEVVEQMMKKYNQECVELAKNILKKMNRTNLVQRLSNISPGTKAKQQPSLIQRVETMASIIELLLETLADLSDGEPERLEEFLRLYRLYLDIPWMLLKLTGIQDIVFLMVLTNGKECVEQTKAVLKTMKRADLVPRLSNSSSGPKKKPVDEHLSALIHKMATISAVKQLLLETLNGLSDEEQKNFKWLLQFRFFKRCLPHISRLQDVDGVDLLVDRILKTCGQQSVEVTMEVLMDMNRSDLVQKLSETFSGPKAAGPSAEAFVVNFMKEEKHSLDECWPALIPKVEMMASVIELILETLADLTDMEIEKFKDILLHRIHFHSRSLSVRRMLEKRNIKDIVFPMVQTNGQQSLEKTKKVLKKMKRTDLIQRLSDSSSGLEKKHSADEQHSKLIQRVATIAAVKQLLLETLNDLSNKEVQKFKEFLQLTVFYKDLPDISYVWTHTVDRAEIADQMVQTFGQQSVELTRKVCMDMNRTDLVQKLSESSPRPKGPSGRLELEGCDPLISKTDCPLQQDSSDWTKLEPKVKSTDADESPTYSLESEAGNFECSVSGLRWVCKEKVSFKYQFCSWGEAMERMESLSYMPAGPLIDITVIAGKLNEVFLPHWICIEDNPEICDKFAVLHISDCGDVVETVSEVTASHVKLPEPVFSLRAALMKTGFFSLKINCNVLIYKTNTAFLTLHVFLIPKDPGLQQAMDKRELSLGYKVIQKPYPEKSLKMHDRFILTADVDGAKIDPEKLKLRYESRDPNFFEVFIENPDRNFTLTLTKENERLPVWTRTIRKDEYRSPGNIQGEHFVDKHQCDLIERVSNIGPILDKLLREGVIQQEDYDRIRAIPTTQEKMRELYRGPLKAAGHAGKEIFYQILVKEESYLVADLKRNES